MQYTKAEKLEIGRREYEGEITRSQAATEYNISVYTVRDYMRLYRDENGLPPKKKSRSALTTPASKKAPVGMSEFEAMTKEELIQELVRARITEARLKKGYEVKGDGSVIRYGSKNTK